MGAMTEYEDATRRTRLANERTYLAWWRTGLTALAVAFGAGKIVPEVSGGAQWPWTLIGISFGVAGVALIGYGFERHRRVEDALRRGEYSPLDTRAALVFAAAGMLLGIATVVVLALEA